MDISSLESKIARKQENLAQLQRSLEKDKKQLAEMQRQAPEPPAVVFLTLECDDNMGLHNKPCPLPYAKCALHNCLLSYKDVRKRRCVMKLCKHLEDIECVL